MAIVRVPVRMEDSSTPGGPWMNVLHVSTQVGGQPGDLGEALDALEAFYEGVRGFMPNTTTITLGEGMISDPGGSPTYVPDDSRTLVGGGAADQHLPALLAIVVGWRTASATRSGRGRTFVGPLVVSAKDSDGTPTAAVVTAITNAAAALVSDSQSANGWAFGVLSTKTGTFRDVSGSSVRDRFAFLSSRRD